MGFLQVLRISVVHYFRHELHCGWYYIQLSLYSTGRMWT